jgi:poly-gamma-glutamate capsule biosynthesis protein CapA/YwtB (metallophosphatase superfamily)
MRTGLTFSRHTGPSLLSALLVLTVACGVADPTVSTPSPNPEATSAEQSAPVPSVNPTPPQDQLPVGGPITINAVGDLMLERDIITLMDQNGSAYPYTAVGSILADADITIGNMEGTFTERGTQATKFYTFRTPPRHARGLFEVGFDVVSLANNHTMDYGALGLTDTLAALDAAGVKHSGAGVDSAGARKPVILETQGKKIAFLSYNAVLEATFASSSSPGVAMADEASIRADVAAAKQVADIVIVSLHAGTEYQDAPTAEQRRLDRAAIDAGASILLGHHAHVFQGWERYGRGVIVYGLGNFVFDLDTEDLATLGPRPFQTAVMRFELSPEGEVLSVTARPVFIDPLQNRPVPATGERLAEIEARIRTLNSAFQ